MTLWQDLRFAARLLVKDRWFTFAAVAALSLGIGATTTVFTFVNAVLIRGLPFESPERIVALGGRDDRGREFGVSLQDFDDWRASAKSFAGLSLMSAVSFNVSDEGQPPEQYTGPYMSTNMFSMLGQRLALGRDFTAADEKPGAPPVVIIGASIWKNRYGSDPAVLGRVIRVNDLAATVIGVMPNGMHFPPNSDIWLPLSQLPASFRALSRNARNYNVVGRLAPDATLAQARAEMVTIGEQLAREYADTNKNVTPTVAPVEERVTGPQIRLVFLALMGAVVFVLLIACANVANLLLARAADRSREVAVRVSLGATRGRIVSQLLVESVLLATISGLLGLAFAMAGVRIFDAAVQDVGKPYWIQFTFDPIVFALLAAVCLGAGIVFGLAPALHVSKTDVHEVLKEGGRSGSGGLRARRWTSALVVGELALTLALLAGAGFMMRSFLQLYRFDPGVDTTHMLTMNLALPDRKYPTPEQRVAFINRVEERLGAIGALDAGATASSVPMGGGPSRALAIERRPTPEGERPPQVTVVTIGAKYFDAIGVTLLRGRPFIDADGSVGQEHVIVNQRFADVHFGGENPIGQRIRLIEQTPGAATPVWTTIVGVSPTITQRVPQGVRELTPDVVVYQPHRANPLRSVQLIVRSRADAASIVPLVREEVRALDPDLPVSRVRTMDQVLAQQRWPLRVFGTMFAVFAVIALVLSAVGLHAVTSYSVTQRTQEIGIRMALGARPEQVRWMIARRALIQLSVGLVLGLAAAVGVGRLLQSVLVATPATDVATLASIAGVLVAVALIACVASTRRATGMDPLMALRME